MGRQTHLCMPSRHILCDESLVDVNGRASEERATVGKVFASVLCAVRLEYAMAEGAQHTSTSLSSTSVMPSVALMHRSVSPDAP